MPLVMSIDNDFTLLYNHIYMNILCEKCGKEFSVFRSRYLQSKHHYCSYACYWEAKTTKVERVCKNCNSVFKVILSTVKQNYGLFCSDECRRVYGRAHRKDRKTVWTNFNHSDKGKNYSRHWHRIKDFGYDPVGSDSVCLSCGSKDHLLVHHKDGKNGKRGKPLNNDRDNLVILCQRCHPRFHGRWGLKEVVPYGV